MPSLISAQGGSQNAVVYFDSPISAITAADISFSPDPGISSVNLSPNKEYAVVFFATSATPGDSYTVTVSAAVSTPPLENTVLTFPLVFGGSPLVNNEALQANAGFSTAIPNLFNGAESYIDLIHNSGITSTSGHIVFQGISSDFGSENTNTSEKPMTAEVIQVVYYLMRAYNTNTHKHVWWVSEESPDFTGINSGFSTEDLTDIILDQTICP